MHKLGVEICKPHTHSKHYLITAFANMSPPLVTSSHTICCRHSINYHCILTHRHNQSDTHTITTICVQIWQNESHPTFYLACNAPKNTSLCYKNCHTEIMLNHPLPRNPTIILICTILKLQSSIFSLLLAN